MLLVLTLHAVLFFFTFAYTVLSIGQETLPLEDFPAVKGIDFNKPEVTLADMMGAMGTTGFQATEMARAVEEINRMRNWRLRLVAWLEESLG